MKDNKFITGATLVVVLALLVGGIFLLSRPSGEGGGQSHEAGSVPTTNVPWWTNGYKYGASNALFTSAVLTVNNGQDQAVWKNNTGQPVVIDTTHLVINATSSRSVASSTYAFSVGATSTATIPEPRSLTWITNASTSLAVDKWTVATGTDVANLQAGLTWKILTDNFFSHASTSCAVGNCSTFIVVPPNQYFFVKIDTLCAYAQGGASCELATSTNRGFTTLSVPFWYHYASPN